MSGIPIVDAVSQIINFSKNILTKNIGVFEISDNVYLKTKYLMAYFEGARRGEMRELHEALNSRSLDDKKTALKKVIAQMTVGKDLSDLFQPVIKCLEFNDLEIKKLVCIKATQVYLYVINYSRTKPDDAIMCINLFRKDALNKGNPLLRALAVRTMSCLRVPKLNEYLIEPLKLALSDTDPYVRKTAVLSVPKVYQIAMNDPETNNLVEMLKTLLQNEPNGLVLANCIASLQEISLTCGKDLIQVDAGVLSRLLMALNECNEWGQVFILDYLTRYSPKDQKQTEMVIDRVIPRLSHINPAVVFGSIKLMVRYLDFLSNEELVKNLCKKIGPSLVSLVEMNKPEIQYVLLKNIQYIMQKRPMILQNQKKECFFCKFTEPYYIKNQKIEILIRIVNYKNYQPVLNELKEYVTEGDPDFVRRSLRAISKIAIRFEKSIDKCLEIMAKQIKEVREVAEHANHVVNQLLTSMQTILRKYPSKFNYDDMFKDLVQLLPHATETDAKQAAAWILGQYAEEIYKGAIQTFNRWIDTFTNEERAVQLQILTSAVKVFIKYPDECESLISNLLTIATERVGNPDVRDRAYIYWRMLSTDTEKTKNVIFGYRPNIKDDDVLTEPNFLSSMVQNMGYVSSVFQRRPQDLFQKSLAEKKNIKRQEEDDDVPQEMPPKTSSQKEQTSNQPEPTPTQPISGQRTAVVQQPPAPPKQQEIDLLDMM